LLEAATGAPPIARHGVGLHTRRRAALGCLPVCLPPARASRRCKHRTEERRAEFWGAAAVLRCCGAGLARPPQCWPDGTPPAPMLCSDAMRCPLLPKHSRHLDHHTDSRHYSHDGPVDASDALDSWPEATASPHRARQPARQRQIGLRSPLSLRRQTPTPSWPCLRPWLPLIGAPPARSSHSQAARLRFLRPFCHNLHDPPSTAQTRITPAAWNRPASLGTPVRADRGPDGPSSRSLAGREWRVSSRQPWSGDEWPCCGHWPSAMPDVTGSFGAAAV
ncbi:hypothetical protein BS50DRAFT_665557, partial [Corynespora cassiicola Philippines]